MPEPSESLDARIPALTVATDDLRTALRALEIAKNHPNDIYHQRQAREHVWKCYWVLRRAAGDAPRPAAE